MSLLPTITKQPLSKICIPSSLADSFLPCKNSTLHNSSLLDESGTCGNEGKVPLVPAEGIQQLQMLILILAIFHVLSCVLTLGLGEAKELRTLLQRTRIDFISLQSHLQNELKELETQIQGLSGATIAYHLAIKENRHLHDMLQELKGNIRVFCRIRPNFDLEGKCSIDFIGNDGSLMIFDPLKPQNTSKVFHFNKVFGPTVHSSRIPAAIPLKLHEYSSLRLMRRT